MRCQTGGGVAAEGGMNLAGMMPAVDHHADCPVDCRQFAESREAECVAARREVGVEADPRRLPVRAYRSRMTIPVRYGAPRGALLGPVPPGVRA